MVEGRQADPGLVPSLLPAGRRERRLTGAVLLLSVAVCLSVAPFARVKLPALVAFMPGYESAQVISDLITAALLFGQSAIGRSRALLILASSYLFTALITIPHALSFPGLFSAAGVLGGGAQSTAWLYMFWHAGLPVGVAGYALLRNRPVGARHRPAWIGIVGSVAAVAGLVLALTALATAGEALLPEIMQDSHYTPAMIFVVASVWTLSLLALLILATRRPYVVLDLWLMAVLCAWLCDIALSAVLNGGRFDLGFYAGRIYGLAAASVVLVMLLLETIAVYARLARSMEAEAERAALRADPRVARERAWPDGFGAGTRGQPAADRRRQLSAGVPAAGMQRRYGNPAGGVGEGVRRGGEGQCDRPAPAGLHQEGRQRAAGRGASAGA
jgi:two-component system, sensor histidine kinase and response regulator